MGKRASKQSSDIWIFLIGIFKLVKGLSLLIAGIGLLNLLHRDIAQTAMHWIDVLRLDPGNRYIHKALLRIFRITPKQLEELSVGTFIYAGVFLTEGTGLLMRKHWAEYLTTISTGLFIPLEIYEIWRRFTWIRIAILILNIATVWYLAARIKRRRV